jgi:hypothetical protein
MQLSISFDEMTAQLDRNPFFTINNSQVIFHFKGEEIKVDLHLISNVRMVKKRVFFINILLTVLGLSFYNFISAYYSFNSSFIFLFVIIAITLIASFSIKQFSYKLLINKGQIGFNELRVSEKNVIYAQYFMLIYKKSGIQNEDSLSAVL